MSVAELPWYDLAELRPATDAWWRGVAWHLRARGLDDVPTALRRGRGHTEAWGRPDLLLGQACGYDVLYDAADDIVPIATPCYAAEGCEGPRYRSFVVVRADRPWRRVAELRGLGVAVNERSSHSGTNALRPHVAPLHESGQFFGAVVETGSHLESLSALHRGRVDVACIDAVVLALLRRLGSPLVRGLRAVTCTRPALAPPYVTSRQQPESVRLALQQALVAAVHDPSLAEARRALLLFDFVCFPASAYAELEDFETPAIEAGYRELPAPRRSPLGAPHDAGPASRGACAG